MTCHSCDSPAAYLQGEGEIVGILSTSAHPQKHVQVCLSHIQASSEICESVRCPEVACWTLSFGVFDPEELGRSSFRFGWVETFPGDHHCSALTVRGTSHEVSAVHVLRHGQWR